MFVRAEFIFLAVFGIALSACAGSNSGNETGAITMQDQVGERADQAAPFSASTSLERKLLAMINASRAEAGLPPYRLSAAESRGDKNCRGGSYQHSVYMASVDALNHDDFPADICLPTSRLAENVGTGTGTGTGTADELEIVRSIHEGMMHEAAPRGHYKNIMDQHYNTVGIGIFFDHGTVWVTEDFLQL